MGLLSSSRGEDKFNKFEKLNGKKAKEILGYMDKKNKNKVKRHLNEVAEENKSVHQVAQDIQENLGSEMKRKFIHAAKKRAGGGLTEAEKRRNLAKRREETGWFGGTNHVRSKVSFAGGDVETSHRVSLQSDTSGEKSSGFAQSSGKRSTTLNDSSGKKSRGGGVGFTGDKGGSFARGGSGKSGGGGKNKKGGAKPLGF